MTKLSYEDFKKELDQFTGSENMYRHPLNRSVVYSEGAKFVADECGAYWLLDEIALSQSILQVHNQYFQVWNLSVEGSKATLTCEDGYYKPAYSKNIPLTDFPFPEISLWFTNNTIFLPTEY